MIKFPAFQWHSTPPDDIPFPKSQTLRGIRFTGQSSDYAVADTWYPSWASDDVLYSPFTDGTTMGMTSISAGFSVDGTIDETGFVARNATTGYAALKGKDPLNLEIVPLG